jgi:hypothetical protein
MTPDPAMWKMLEQYKELRAEKDRREAKGKHWGHKFSAVGEFLVSNGMKIADFSELPTTTELIETQRELSLLYDQIACLRRELQQKGMGDYL